MPRRRFLRVLAGCAVICGLLAGGGVLAQLEFAGATTQSQATGSSGSSAYSVYLTIAESYRGGTTTSVTALTTAPGDTVDLFVVDSIGSYYLQVQPLPSIAGLNTSEQSQLSIVDSTTHALTRWTVGSDGWVSQPTTEEPGSTTNIDIPAQAASTPPTLPSAGPAPAIEVNDYCTLSVYGPIAAPPEEFGYIIEGTSLVNCTYQSSIGLTDTLQEFDVDNGKWIWLTVDSNGNSDFAYTLQVSADAPCNGYGTTTWQFNNVGTTVVIFEGITSSKSGNTQGAVPCDPIF